MCAIPLYWEILGFIMAEQGNPFHGRDGRVSTSRGVGNPCRRRAVVMEGKWPTE